MNETSAAANVELVMVGAPTPAQRRALERVRGVETITALRAPGVQVPALPALQSIGVPEDAQFGVTIDRARIIAGHAADQSVSDEVTIGEGLATRLHLRPGETLDIESYTPEQIAAILGGAEDVGPRRAGVACTSWVSTGAARPRQPRCGGRPARAGASLR
jgi:hypothetical protein